MFLRFVALLAAGLAAAAALTAQSPSSKASPQREPPPKQRPAATPRVFDPNPTVITVTPSDSAPPAGTIRPSGPPRPTAHGRDTCAIPLLNAVPLAGGAVRQFDPGDRGDIRVIEPSVCDGWLERRGYGPLIRPAPQR
jgi:hypothetical protein